MKIDKATVASWTEDVVSFDGVAKINNQNCSSVVKRYWCAIRFPTRVILLSTTGSFHAWHLIFGGGRTFSCFPSSSNLAVSAARAASAPSRFSFEEIDPVTPGRFS